jgi:hypothetical protein
MRVGGALGERDRRESTLLRRYSHGTVTLRAPHHDGLFERGAVLVLDEWSVRGTVLVPDNMFVLHNVLMLDRMVHIDKHPV